MPYKDEYHPRVKADLKRLDKEVVRELHGLHIGKILRDPQASEKLYGDLEGVFTYHFRKNKVDYRIASSPTRLFTLLWSGKGKIFTKS